MYSRQFANELGNTIILQVKEEKRHDVSGVFVYIAGPDSDTELFVTRQEAVELLEGLYKVLKTKKR